MGRNTYIYCLYFSFVLEVVWLNTEVQYVKLGGSVTLNCSTSNSHSATWRHKKIIYSVGSNVNSDIGPKGKLSVVGDHEKGEYNLKIQNISHSDEGRYWCIFSRGIHGTDKIFDVKIMVPPSNLVILNQTRHMIHAEEGQEVKLICTVNNGIPKDHISWYKNGEMLINGSGTILYTFVPSFSDHLNIYVCRAYHKALDRALETSVQLILSQKPIVNLTVYPCSQVVVGSDVTLSCRIDNPIDLTDIVWTQDNKTLNYRTTDVNLPNVSLSNSGTYTCLVENKHGRSLAQVVLDIRENNQDYTNTVPALTVAVRPPTATYLDKDSSFQSGSMLFIIVGVIGVIVILLLILSVIFIILRRFKPRTVLQITPSQDEETRNPSNNSDNVDGDYEEVDQSNMEEDDRNRLRTQFPLPASTGSQTSSSSSEGISMKSGEATVNSDGYINPYHSLDVKSRNSTSTYDKCEYQPKSVRHRTI